MPNDVTLSASVRSNLLSLQNTAELLARTQERLATGKKVNTALDNPTNFFTASGLTHRSNALNALLDSVSNGIQVLKAADTGITSLTKLIEQAQATARDALQSPKGTYEYKKAEILGSVALINDTAAVAVGTNQITTPDLKSATGTVNLAGADRGARITGSTLIPADVTPAATGTAVIAADTPATVTGTVNGLTGADTLVGTLGFTIGETITISDGTTSYVLNIAGGTTVQNLIDGINNYPGLKVTADLSGGALRLTADDNTVDISIASTDAINTNLGLGVDAGTATVERTNASLAAAVAGNETLTFQVAGQPLQTITFGTGVGQVSNRAELEAALATAGAAGGFTATFNASNRLTITSNSTDELTIGGTGVADFGLTAGTIWANPALNAIPPGATLEFSVGGGATQTVTFGTGAGQVNTRAELTAAITALLGVDATVNATTGRIEITGESTAETVEILASSDATALSTLGLTAGTYSPGNEILDELNGKSFVITVGSTPYEINFDASNNTTAELLAQLNGIAGIAASINSDGQLVIGAVDATQNLSFSGDDDVIRTLGLRPGLVEASNTAFTAAGIANSKFTISVNDGQNIEFVLGDGPGQIGSKEELVARLSAIEGIHAEFNGAGQLVIEAEPILNSAGQVEKNATDIKFRIGGDKNALTALGVTAFTYSASNADLDDLAGKTIQVSVGTSTKTIQFGSDAGIGEINSIAELKAELAKIGAELLLEPEMLDGDNPLTPGIETSYASGKNFLKITTTDAKAAKNITISSDSDSFAVAGLGLRHGTVESKVTAIIESNEQRASAESDFNDMLKQIDAMARDASYNGVNLLDNDDLRVIFNEDGSSKLDITGVNFSAEGLGLETLTLNDFQDDNKINATLDKLEVVMHTLRAQSARFGSNLSIVQARHDFTKNLINVLDTGASNLTLADTNEEGANMLALQTRQQLSTTALSLAAQADQAVLRLFG